jgi:hypothetical protein
MSLPITICIMMVRSCENCGKEGGIFDFDLKSRSLPLSGTKILCSRCYSTQFSEENKEYQHIIKWKNKILRTFYEGSLKQLCREQGISIMQKRWTTAVSRGGTSYRRQYNYYYTFEELVSVLIRGVSLKDMIDFCKKKNIPIREIELEIDSFYHNKNSDNSENISEVKDEKIQQILEKIDEFTPLLPYYPTELCYQLDLGRYLLNYFPSTVLEEQRSSARPDIVIDDVAIEIKGPTQYEALQSITEKCVRYPLYFKKGFIVVLFDVKITHRFLDDWQKGLQNNFPNIIIRCK